MINIFRLSIVSYPLVVITIWLFGYVLMWLCSIADPNGVIGSFFYGIYAEPLITIPALKPIGVLLSFILLLMAVLFIVSLIGLVVLNTIDEVKELQAEKKKKHL
ncbi:hypothetical protein GHT89_16375 [Acinetobacter baumannii]|uniref:hypothetical protein n=1 Tax=Acinetobacter baumannii TaxID=470 RepID=UPI00387DC7EF